MLKKYLIVVVMLFSLTSIYAGEFSDAILELQKNEAMLVDMIYDHRDYAIELWNSIDQVEDPKVNVEQSIAALEYAEQLSILLFKVEDQLIVYYSKHLPDAHNLEIVNNNRHISEGIVKEVVNLKTKFIDYKSQAF